VQKVAKQKYNLDVEVVTFNDFVLPNEALNNGDLAHSPLAATR
jgi:D-methionine transport system substrate-binding protein